jgi:regulatory protein
VAFARIEKNPSGEGYQALLLEGSSFSITADVFRSLRLSLGQELSEEQYQRLRTAQMERNCRSQALAYLARREHTAYELTQKLQVKGFDRTIITPVLEKLAEEDLLSEYRYALLTIEHRQRKNPEGRALLAQRLASKGVNRQDAQRALDELFNEELATEYAQRAYQLALAKGGKENARLLMSKRGFSSYEIRLALEQE